MKQSVLRRLAAVLVVPAALAAPAGAARAQETAPQPVVVIGNAQATLLFDQVSLAPGDRLEKSLDVSGFARVSFLAAAQSGPNFGTVAVNTRFGPPAVPVPNALALVFNGGTTARRGDHLPVMGPGLTVELVNHTSQPVQVSLGVYAVK